ncbi:gluconokinase [Enterococcus sp. LJL99]
MGIDIGTTAIKFGIVKEGEMIYSSEKLNQTTINGAKHIQTASSLKSNLIAGLKEIPDVFKRTIGEIGLSTAMHSLMPVVNNSYEEIFLWSDCQADKTIEQFKKTAVADQFYKITGTPIHSMSTFAKILHLKNSPEFANTQQWYGVKEWLLYELTNNWAIDRSTASATGLYSLAEKNWSKDILTFLKISDNQLARLVDYDHPFKLSRELAKELGFLKDVTVYPGGSDGCLAAFSSYKNTGCVNSLTIGTSATVRKISDGITLDSQGRYFCYYLREGTYVIGVPSNNGGCLLEWAKNAISLNPNEFYSKELTTSVNKTNVGANGLRFFPYLNGERAPLWNPGVTGTFKNLQLTHTREELIRAILEGLLMNIYKLKKIICPEKTIVLSGGVFRNTEIQQLTADILNNCCILSDKNEPIVGLYYLFHKVDNKKNKREGINITANVIQAEKYKKIKECYFD